MSDIALSRQPSIDPSLLQKTTSGDAVAKGGPVGGGINAAAAGNTPPTTKAEADSPGLAALMESLKGLMTEKAPQDTEVLLVQVLASMKDAETASQKDKVKLDQETKRTQLEEKQHKLEESAKKLQESLDKKHSNNIFDKIKLLFEWIGALLAVVTAALLIATGVGAIAGTLLIAAAVTAVVMSMSDTVQQITKDAGLNGGAGFGIAGGFQFLVMTAQGADPAEIKKAVQKADMGFSISMTVLTVAFSLGAAGAALATGVGTAMSKVTTGVADKLATGWNTFKAGGLGDAATTAAKGAQIGARMAEGATVAEQMATAGVSVARGVNSYQAASLDADTKRLNAEAKVMQGIMTQLDDMIDQALQRLIGASERFNDMLDMIVESLNDKAGAAASMKFRA
ncbi:MAG: type III secretion system translocon subunit SctE [Allorhizobium sp.]